VPVLGVALAIEVRNREKGHEFCLGEDGGIDDFHNGLFNTKILSAPEALICHR
jgi:hypothetical protein